MKITKTLPLIVLASSLLMGCGAIRASIARDAVIRDATEVHQFEASRIPKQRCFLEMQNKLFAEGYSAQAGSGIDGAFSFATEWRAMRDNNGQLTEDRLMIQLIDVSETHYQVRVQRSVKNNDYGTIDTDRDHNTEWELIQAVDPEGAAMIEQEAQARANAARNG